MLTHKLPRKSPALDAGDDTPAATPVGVVTLPTEIDTSRKQLPRGAACVARERSDVRP
jgi:hypothetical protein